MFGSFVYHLCAWCLGGRERLCDPLELQLQTVVSHYVVLGIEPLEEQQVLLTPGPSLQALLFS